MKKILIFMLAVVMIFSFTACSNEDNAAVEDEGTGSGGESQALIVGTEPTFPPFEFTEEETGDIIGFDIDLIKAIADDQGFEVEIQSLGFDALVMAIQSGNIDIIASGMTINDEREKKVDFSTAYINAGLALAVSADNDTITSVDDLAGKKVAVQIGTTGAEKAQELLDADVIEEIVTLNTVDLVMMELINGGVDAVINDLPVTKAYMNQQPDKIKIVGEPLNSESYGFAVSENNTELLEKINQGLQNVMDNGTYDEIQAKYFQ